MAKSGLARMSAEALASSSSCNAHCMHIRAFSSCSSSVGSEYATAGSEQAFAADEFLPEIAERSSASLRTQSPRGGTMT